MIGPRRSMLLAGFLTALATGFWLLTLLPMPWSLVSLLWLCAGIWLGVRTWGDKVIPPAPVVSVDDATETEVLPVPQEPTFVVEDSVALAEPLRSESTASSDSLTGEALRAEVLALLHALDQDSVRPDELGPGFQELLNNEAFIRENVLRSFEIADNLSGSAEHAFSLSERVQKGVAVVTDALLESRKQTDVLSGHSERITSILGSMAEVSDKIHVLSINASIVSARAGVAGRGFEVVAKEIRALAKESETSLGGIVEVIDLLRSSIEKVNKVVRDADAETEHEKNSLIEVAGSLQGVSLGVEIVKAVSTFAKDKAEEQERLVRRLSAATRGPSLETQRITAALKARLSQTES